jgi:hypothetical protein
MAFLAQLVMGSLLEMCPKWPALYNVKQAGEAGEAVEASSSSPRAKLGGWIAKHATWQVLHLFACPCCTRPSVFFSTFCDVAKILIIEDLAKFGYKNRYECFLNMHPYTIFGYSAKKMRIFFFWEERNVVTFLKFVANLLLFGEILFYFIDI